MTTINKNKEDEIVKSNKNKEDDKEISKVEQALKETEEIEEIAKKILGQNSTEVKACKKSFSKDSFGVEQWIAVDKLIIDQETQRSSMETHIKKIVNNFDPKAFGRISVSQRDDSGRFYINDGQHRYSACKQLGINIVPCIVVQNIAKNEKESKKNDARQFLAINENSSSVSAIDKYFIGVSAELPDWLRVKKVVVDDNDLPIGTSASCVNAVATIYKYINGSSKQETINAKMKHMSTAIEILNDTAGVTGITNLSLNGMCLFVREYITSGIITKADAMNKFSKVNLKKLIITAQSMKNNDIRGNVNTYLACVFYEEYNKRSKDKQLPLRFEI